jgi:ribosomal protein S18 acetylase RimI-like enzyme
MGRTKVEYGRIDAAELGPLLRTEIEAERGICEELRFEAVRGFGRLRFVLLEYVFFRGNEKGSALSLSLPWFLSPLSLTLHMVKSRALSLFRLPCYFVKLGKETVGLLAIQDQNKCLVVTSLGVGRLYRRLGIGTCILGCVEAAAKRMGKKTLEVDVYGKNIPAVRLYTRYGFTFVPSLSIRGMSRGSKSVSARRLGTMRIGPWKVREKEVRNSVA